MLAGTDVFDVAETVAGALMAGIDGIPQQGQSLFQYLAAVHPTDKKDDFRRPTLA